MNFKQAIVVRSDLGMGRGKMAAQASHASVHALLEAMRKAPEDAEMWLATGGTKITLKVNSEKELQEVFEKAKRKKLPCSLIHDAGRTQIPQGSATAVAIGPAKEKEVDEITGKLKLL